MGKNATLAARIFVLPPRFPYLALQYTIPFLQPNGRQEGTLRQEPDGLWAGANGTLSGPWIWGCVGVPKDRPPVDRVHLAGVARRLAYHPVPVHAGVDALHVLGHPLA